MTQAAVSRIERGLTDPRWDTVCALFMAMGYVLKPQPRPLESRADSIHLADLRRRSLTDRMQIALSANRLAGELRRAGQEAVRGH